VKFNGRMVRPYNAVFLFGHNGKGKEVISAQDAVFSDNDPLSIELDDATPIFPNGTPHQFPR
jgi:hypothetical protein